METEKLEKTKAIATTVNYINIETVQHLTSATTLGNFKTSSGTTSNKNDETKNQSLFGRIVNRLIQKDTTYGLREKLKSFYLESTLPCVAWLDKGQDLMIDDYYTELQLNTSNVTIPVEKIFAKVNNKRPQRILIDGQPGFGKTTLVTKIISDWANSRKYINHFKLAFLLPLRELRQRNINEVLTAIATHCGFSSISSIKHIIDTNESNTLLIIDGLDEFSTPDRIDILKLLYKQIYGTMTVIVTCRTGLFALEHDELNMLFGGISKKKIFYEVRIQVLGIGIKDRKKFLLKFIPQNTADDIIKQIERLTKPIDDMFRSPLFLILLAFMASQKNDLTTLTTRTQLFKKLFNFIIKSSVKTNISSLDSEFDLFQVDSQTNDLQKTIQDFGNLSLDHILRNDLQFECNALTMQVYRMGFLIIHKETSSFQSTSHYEAFHLSILEFAAAFSIWMDFKQQTNGCPENSFRSIQSLYFKLERTSLIPIFLVGLLHDEADEFFKQLLPIAHIISTSEDTLWNLLEECQLAGSICNKLMAIVNDFIPPHIHLWNELFYHFYSSGSFKNVIKCGIQSGKLKHIYINCMNPSIIPQDLTIPELWIDVLPNSPLVIEKLIKNIKCQKLSLRFSFGSSQHLDYSILWSYICLLSTLPKESCSLYIDGVTLYNTIHKQINNVLVKEIQFNNLRIHMTQAIREDLVTVLLRRNQVKALQLIVTEFSSDIKPDKIFHAAANSSNLDALHVISNIADYIPIDLHEVTNGGKKHYNCLMLKQSPLLCKKPLISKNCINTVIIKESYRDFENRTFRSVEGLTAIDPIILECDTSLFDKLPHSWTGYMSLKELSLSIDKSSIEEEFWCQVCRCTNLNMLELNLPLSDQVHTLLPINAIVKCLQELPIERFSLWRINPKYSVIQKLIESIADSFPWSTESKFKTIDLGQLTTIADVEQIENLCSVIRMLLNCLQLNHIETLNIITRNRSLWHALMQKNLIDHFVFQVTHSMYGSSDDDPDYYKTWYNMCSFLPYFQFCIKLKQKQMK